MSSDAPFTAVRDLLTAQWSGAPLVWPNEGMGPTDSSMPWVYVDMSGNDMAALELGASAVYAERGIIFAHIMCPVGTGTLELRTIAKALSDLFRSAKLPGMTFGRQSLGSGEIGDDDGLWFRQSFTVDYVYQDKST